jgi:CheY-like chemotaxis protein
MPGSLRARGLKLLVSLHISRDGEQALQVLGERYFNPDLLILDLNIPKMSGYAVLALYTQ